MKTVSYKYLVRSLTAVSLALLGSSAFALSTWTLNNCTSCAASDGAGFVTVTAFSVLNSGGAYAAATVALNGSTGLGVNNSGESSTPQNNTVDNATQMDLLLLNFGNYKVDLNAVNIGVKYDSTGGTTGADADISLFRYTGPSLNPTVSGLSIAQLAGQGWTLVGNYADLAAGANTSVTSTNTTQSSWWLISAYNSNFGAAPAGEQAASGLLSDGNDYFRIASIQGNATRVPEPGSLALLGAGLLGLMVSRRRKQAALAA